MFQKKVIEPEPVQLKEKEITKLKEKLIDKKVDDLDNLKIRDLEMSEIVPQSYNGTVITILEGYHTLALPYGMEKNKFKTFRKSAGGLFSKDVLNYSRGKQHGKYVLIEGKGERKIVRLIEDHEISLFDHLKLIKGIIKDKPYMLLKNLGENEKLSSTQEYIKENSEHLEEEETIVITPQVAAVVDDDFETHTSSVSLFDE